MEAVKTMIHDQDLPMHLLAEAARTVVYVQNRLSHNSLGFNTSEEMYIGNKPKVIHLKIFGCPVYVHIPKDKRTQLDPLKIKEYLLDIVKSPNPLGYTFQDSII